MLLQVYFNDYTSYYICVHACTRTHTHTFLVLYQSETI